MSIRRFATARRWLVAWRWIVGLGLLGALVAVVGLGELAATLRRAAPGWVVLVIALNLLWLGLGALNVWILLRRLAPLPFSTFLPPYLLSWATSLLLPGQLGDATQVVLLRRYGVPMKKSGAAYLLDKSLTLALVVLLAAYGTELYFPGALGWWWLLMPAATVIGGTLFLVLMRRKPHRADGLLARLQASVVRLLGEIDVLRRHHLGTLLLNAILTVAKWMVLSVVYLGAFRAFGFPLEPLAAATIPMMSSIPGYLPISAGGIGTMEWTAVVLFRQAGAESTTVLSVYLLLRVTLILTALVFLATRARDGHRAAATDAGENAGP